MYGGRGDYGLDGDEGNDIINGHHGDDELEGDKGADKISGKRGNDLVMDEEGNDQLNGGKGDDRAPDGEVDDERNGGVGDYILVGGMGRDTFICDRFDQLMNFIEEDNVGIQYDMRNGLDSGVSNDSKSSINKSRQFY